MKLWRSGGPAGDTVRAMSQENVELVRSVFDGWAHGDFNAGLDLLAPELGHDATGTRSGGIRTPAPKWDLEEAVALRGPDADR